MVTGMLRFMAEDYGKIQTSALISTMSFWVTAKLRKLLELLSDGLPALLK